MSEANPVVLLGADPEIFVKDRNGTPLPIFDKVGGTKQEPIQMKGMAPGFFYQEDGAALEFNIPPASRPDEFVESIRAALRWMTRNLLDKQQLSYYYKNSIKLKNDYRNHPNALRLGCSFDHHAWDNDLPGFQRKPLSADILGVHRYAGFHLHLSYNHEAVPHNIAAQFMDLFVGLEAVQHDKQGGRRRYYGLPGLYRPKSYGIEYRTLSSALLSLDNETLHYVIKHAFDFGRMSYTNLDALLRLHDTAPWQDVRTAIETQDEKLANAVLRWKAEQLLRS